MVNENSKNRFEVLSGREQILRRPQMWIGGMDPIEKEMFIILEDKIERKNITYIPAFRKIQDEILDNSLDVLIEKCNSTGEIKVKMTDSSVLIEDNGPGIPVIKHNVSKIVDKSISEEEKRELSNSYIPYTAWTRLFSGSNFQDSDDKTTIGSHGIGSKACSVFSTKFIGITDDGKKKCTVTTKNNLEDKNCKVSSSSGKTGTSVEFWPDLKRFNLEKIDEVYFDLMYQRLLSLSITFPKIKFSFNGKKININDKKFLSMFSEHIEFQIFDKGFVGIFPNEYDEFNFFSYVNGLFLSRGGSHIEYIINNIVNPIREKLVKKFKNIKPADIKNKFSTVVFMRDFANPKFDSQTKETLTNAPSDISKYIADKIDFDKFAKQILKNDFIINPIIETFKIKEELKARSELKQVKKIKVKSDKYMPPIGENKFLALCEGMSACSGISSCLGRQGIGYYSMRGLPVNAFSSTIQKVAANQEFKEITTILNLDLSSKNEVPKTISFDKILITTDNDADGSHLTSMLLGWFARFAPNLFSEGKICRLLTPLILVENNKEKIVEYFFNVNDFKVWEANHQNKGYKYKYLKGLGSWERSQLIELIDKHGLNHFIQQYKIDENGMVYFNDWLGNDAEPRKKYLRAYSFDIDKA